MFLTAAEKNPLNSSRDDLPQTGPESSKKRIIDVLRHLGPGSVPKPARNKTAAAPV
jgi:hypothetical protein